VTRVAIEVARLSVAAPSGATPIAEFDMRLVAGECLALIGESGGGKSLVAQALLGLLPPGFAVSGTMSLGGRAPIDLSDLSALRRSWARDLALLPQEPEVALDPTMRVGHQIGRDSIAALAAVDLPEGTADLFAYQLSGGMAQRALVAMALGGDAPVIVADEPSKGLDSRLVERLSALLRNLTAAGRALLVITHDMTLARGLGGRVAVLDGGRLVESGPAEQVLVTPRHPYTRALVAADPANWTPCASCAESGRPVLAAHGATYGRVPGRPLFQDLDLHLPTGGVLAVTGPSGCGKTSLGDLLLGIVRPWAGQIVWDGLDPHADRTAMKRLRRRYQKLHQDPRGAFIPTRRIDRQFADIGRLVGRAVMLATLPRLLEDLKLPERLLQRYPAEISAGEAQRLALVRLLLLDPAVIVADEPTSRLDLLVQKRTIDLLRRIVTERRVALVLIGHDRRLLEATADQVIDLSVISADGR
jgi:peptide/nickel transport system ATP-binding protein